MSKNKLQNLSRRERQIMDVIFRRGKATAGEIQQQMPDPPTYSTVRTILRVLDQKGHVKVEREGRRYVYSPAISASAARRTALQQMLNTFFEGSIEKAMTAMVDLASSKLSDDQWRRLAELIDQAKDSHSNTETTGEETKGKGKGKSQKKPSRAYA